MRTRLTASAALIAAAVLVASVALAQQPQPLAYPAKGQSAEQQDKDQDECAKWARQKSGADSSTATTTASGGAAAPSLPSRPALLAGLPQLPAPPSGLPPLPDLDQVQRQLAQSGARDSQHSAYGRALAACMEARGYVVK
ncbi:hypothetical protein [Caldimonas sp. KR1-144]|uniref:hypothetical protein n=1 Tax=Caldimonas sp. KR1-144 TaxID=3400911 RepID=UPI003C0001A8